MSQNSINKVWQALLRVDQFLQEELIEILDTSSVVKPEEWTVIHEASRILEEERLSIPKELYRLGMTEALTNSLEVNINTLLDMLRELIEARQINDVVQENKVVNKIRYQLEFIMGDYRSKLHDFKEVMDNIMDENQQTKSTGMSINLPSLHKIGRDFIIRDERVGGDQVMGDKNVSTTISQTFNELHEVIKQKPDSPKKSIAETAINQLEAEAEKGDQADEKEVERWFTTIISMLPDIAEVAINTFINPISGLSTVFKKVAEKARDELYSLNIE